MAKKEVLILLASAFISAWVSHVFGSDATAWLCGFAGLVIVIVLLYRQQEAQQTARFTPTPKEVFETAAAQARNHTAQIELQRLQHAEALRAMVRKFEKMENEATKVRGFRVHLQPPVTPEPGEDPEIVSEAFLLFNQRKVRTQPNSDKWHSGW